jgi:D-alanyl-D-alanine carboxypeptidase
MLEDVLDWPRTAEYSAAWTSGGLVSTAADVARWMRALYGGSVLKPDSLTAMTAWVPASGGSSGGTFGLGTMRLHTPMGDFWGHAGSISGYLSCAGHNPTRNVTLVVLVNQDNVYLPAIWNGLVSALQ